MPDILEMPYIVWSPNQLSLAPTPGIEPGPLGLDLHWSMPDIFQMPDIVWCLTHWAIEFAIDFNIRNGKILYSRYSLASVFEQAMRTLQNSKALAGNISMLYHWLWVTVGLWDHMYKSTSYSENFCGVSSQSTHNLWQYPHNEDKSPLLATLENEKS